MTSFESKKFKGKKAGIIGLGKSGLACAKLLAKKGFKVFATDARPRDEVKKSLGRLPGGITWEAGGHSDKILRCAFVVKSPGIKPSEPIFAKLRNAQIPVFSEMEVALSFCKTKNIIAVTGTNGKSTTTALLGEIFHKSLSGRRKTHVCGNIGIPISELAPKAGPKDVIILEASSYQLEDSRHFRPLGAALLNITPDHLDHHGSMYAYLKAKGRLFLEQGRNDFCVFNAGDPLVVKLSRNCHAKKLFFGRDKNRHAWFEKGKIQLRLPEAKKIIALVPPNLPGEHNIDNAMAAGLVALAFGLKPSGIQKAFKSFRGVEHRLEEAGTIQGIRCVNDSKATNVDSTIVALKAFSNVENRLLLILGGRHKGSPYAPLKPMIAKSVKAILTIGSAAGKIEEDLSGIKPIFPCENLAVAVKTAFQIGSKGDILLLSPACASFDQFQNFEDRGKQFKALVKSV